MGDRLDEVQYGLPDLRVADRGVDQSCAVGTAVDGDKGLVPACCGGTNCPDIQGERSVKSAVSEQDRDAHPLGGGESVHGAELGGPGQIDHAGD